MRFTIREGVFETNSSSMHCFGVTSRADLAENPYIPVPEKEARLVRSWLTADGRIDLARGYDDFNGCFEWGPAVLMTPWEKMNYAVAAYLHTDQLRKGDADETITFLLEAIGVPEVTGFVFAQRDTWLGPGRSEVGPVLPDIDHQSIGFLNVSVAQHAEAMNISRAQALHEFIFDGRIRLLVLNDNMEPEEYECYAGSDELIF